MLISSILAQRRLVLRQHDIVGFRATHMRQCKTQSAGNGKPFSWTATPHWCMWVAPFGQDDKRSSALLHSFALATASPVLVRLAAKRFSSCCTWQYHVGGAFVQVSQIMTGPRLIYKSIRNFPQLEMQSLFHCLGKFLVNPNLCAIISPHGETCGLVLYQRTHS
jgi:hypothetical protein